METRPSEAARPPNARRLTKYLFQIIVGATSNTRSAPMDVDQLYDDDPLGAQSIGSTRTDRGRCDPGMLAHRDASGQRVNQQSWRWLVISDPGLRDKVAGLYRDAYQQGSAASSSPSCWAGIPRADDLCHRPSGWCRTWRRYRSSSFRATSHTYRALTATTRFSPRPCMGRSSQRSGSPTRPAQPRLRHLRHHAAPCARRRGSRSARNSRYLHSRLSAPGRQIAARLDLPCRAPPADRGSRRRRHLGTTDILNARVQELCDRADILDCMHRYARGMDRLDRELLRSHTTTTRSMTMLVSSVR